MLYLGKPISRSIGCARPQEAMLHFMDKLSVFFALLIGISLTGCQSDAMDKTTPSPFTEELTPTLSMPLKTDEVTIEPTKMLLTTPVESSVTPLLGTSTPTSDDAYQLTSMNAGEPWWSKDSRTLYFSTIGPDSQVWSIDLTTNAVHPAPDVLSPYRRAISLTASLIPAEVFEYNISVSPSGERIIFPRPIAPTEPAEEFCDGESCISIPANEIWVVDVENRSLTQLQMEGELTTIEVDFLWSGDESRVVIGVNPFWTTGSDTPTVWIADLSSGRVYPMGYRDERVFRRSISPNGDFVIYGVEKSGAGADSCEGHLWIVDSGEESFLPGLPCTPHFWLSDNRTVVFTNEIGRRVYFFAYDVMTSEQQAIASSATLPTMHCWYVLAPDERSVAAVPIAAWEPSGIWLVQFDSFTDH
jgi:hypothetical protein